MAPVAKMFKDLGWKVTGSDKGFFPPMSTYLQTAGVEFYPGWHPERMSNSNTETRISKSGYPDLVVVGNFVGMSNPEFVFVRENGIPYKSYPEVLAEYVIRDESVVVAGTYGKSTIAAAMAWVLETDERNPSYMSGGILKNFPDGVRSTDSEWSVVEGDEYSTSRWDSRPKFAHYKTKYLILTSTKWDHTDIYATEEDYRQVFVDLVKSVPEDGYIVYNIDAVDAEIVAQAKCTVDGYSAEGGIVERDGGVTRFDLGEDHQTQLFETSLIGRHNIGNLRALVKMGRVVGVGEEVLHKAVRSFEGVRRRLEVRNVRANGRSPVRVVDDLAHSPEKVRAGLAALREWYPDARLRVVFEPNIGSRTQEALPLYDGAFEQADEVLVPRLSKAKKREGVEWVDGEQLVEQIRSVGVQHAVPVQYVEDDEQLVARLTDAKKGDVVAFMGSHGFRGMIDEVVEKLGS